MHDTYQVKITLEASTNLHNIFQYIEQDSPTNAPRVIEKLLAAIDDLNFMPSRFRIAGRSRRHGSTVHARVVRPFIVYYRIDEPSKMVFVLEVRHGARKQPRRFD